MNIKSMIKLLFNPKKLCRLLLQRKFPGGLLSDKKAITLLYKQRFKRKPDLECPKTFNEKLLWLTLYDRNPYYITLVDKYRAKEVIEKTVGKQYVVKNLGCWSNSREIDFKCLPSEYVLKCNHDSGSVVICKNRIPNSNELNRLDKALKTNYFWFSREWAYKYVKPLIFAEEYIKCKNEEEGVVDYKFYCFNGVPEYILVISHRSSGGKETFFDLEWNVINVSKGYLNHDIIPEKPSNIDEMVDIAKKLSKNIPFVRVDLFIDIEGNVKVGELTLTPSSGMVPFEPDIYDVIFGSKLELPYKNMNR